MEKLSEEHSITPIFSGAAYTTDTRFGKAADFLARAREITGRDPILTIAQAEPIGPKTLLAALVIAPCTGNTLAKLAHSITDTPVPMAAKSHLRNERPVILAVSTNDALAGAAENIGRLMARRGYFFVPFAQHDAKAKPRSMVADFSQIPQAVEAALVGWQLQPMVKP